MFRFNLISGYVKFIWTVLIISMKLSNFYIIITFILIHISCDILQQGLNDVFKQNIKLT